MMTPTSSYTKAESWKIFDAIFAKYDLLNQILSFGMDQGWRNKMSQLTRKQPSIKLLDLATGTGEVILSLVKDQPRIQSATGIDLSEKMLAIAQEKIKRANLAHKIIVQKGDATAISFADSSFDMTTMAFGIRNIENPIITIKEIYRTLKNQGRVLILEFSMPPNPFFKLLFLGYLKVIVPLVGGIVSGNFKAYYYLNQTIERFPYGETFCRMLKQCGFVRVTKEPLFLGIATLYSGDKDVNAQ